MNCKIMERKEQKINVPTRENWDTCPPTITAEEFAAIIGSKDEKSLSQIIWHYKTKPLPRKNGRYLRKDAYEFIEHYFNIKWNRGCGARGLKKKGGK